MCVETTEVYSGCGCRNVLPLYRCRTATLYPALTCQRPSTPKIRYCERGNSICDDCLKELDLSAGKLSIKMLADELRLVEEAERLEREQEAAAS